MFLLSVSMFPSCSTVWSAPLFHTLVRCRRWLIFAVLFLLICVQTLCSTVQSVCIMLYGSACSITASRMMFSLTVSLVFYRSTICCASIPILCITIDTQSMNSNSSCHFFFSLLATGRIKLRTKWYRKCLLVPVCGIFYTVWYVNLFDSVVSSEKDMATKTHCCDAFREWW